MKNKLFYIFILLAFVLSYWLGQQLGQESYRSTSQSVKEMTFSDCSPVENVCHAFIENIRIDVQFKQTPSALEPFEVEVKTIGFQAEEIFIDFNMVGMDMGFNKHRLNSNTRDSWLARVVLPVCSLGRNDWKSTVYVTRAGSKKILSADFSFNQQAVEY